MLAYGEIAKHSGWIVVQGTERAAKGELRATVDRSVVGVVVGLEEVAWWKRSVGKEEQLCVTVSSRPSNKE